MLIRYVLEMWLNQPAVWTPGRSQRSRQYPLMFCDTVKVPVCTPLPTPPPLVLTVVENSTAPLKSVR